jgi:hypothetical protein
LRGGTPTFSVPAKKAAFRVIQVSEFSVRGAQARKPLVDLSKPSEHQVE